MNELYEQLDFVENPLFEKVIADISDRHYSVVDNFFSAEEVVSLRNSLLQKYEADRFKKSAIGNRTNEMIEKEIRGDFILWMNENETNEAETTFFNKINNLVNYLNRTCFMGILHKEFHYALYPEGTFYQRHLDTFENDDRRVLSVVCYLNDQDWDNNNGGELVLYLDENGSEVEKRLYPLPGRVVIFESQRIEHEVMRVNSSERLSVTGWLKTR
ncbi:SM-20-related protein [Zhouia amylolytica]|uniref:SM-20-related protein n=2 Tax=Zhouia amylolytica TaxID=376730 RepID=A0A1I6SBC8_9FLAO|nr:2OG-Fe(II) oxygenase [Zhouia amylolytica]ETN94748.1 putative proline hydroxylase [Zhouia amylolytica AD3]SFS74214.1 SM-20-related protein [Zhouia amylolytica]